MPSFLPAVLLISVILVEEIKRRVGFIAPVYVYPGEDEMEALALNALAVLTGRREVKEYV